MHAIKVLSLLSILTSHIKSRKSDYKRVIFSDFVKEELRKNFERQYEALKTFNASLIDLYEKLYEEQKDSVLKRLQPELKIGDERNITITGNRKKWLTLKTISKRRPLIFQIDDFLFDDECDHIKTLALDRGLEKSMTTGDMLMESGVHPGLYDELVGYEFSLVDTNNDSHANITEVQRFLRGRFDNTLSLLMVKELMRISYMDFNLDGLVDPWEWKIKNLTKIVQFMNHSHILNPASKSRFSRQQWLPQTNSDDQILHSLQDRLHKLTGLPLLMVENSEPLQVVQYEPGGHYDCHLDSDPRYYVDDFKMCCHTNFPDLGDQNEDDCAACRFMTVLFYLDDTELGGETAFPVAGVDPYKNELVNEGGGSDEEWCDLTNHCKQSKIIMKPKKGRAVLWYNHFINQDTEWLGAVDRNSLHGGCAVHKGVKWIANNWLNAGHHKEHDILSWIMTKHYREQGEIESSTEENKDSKAEL